MLWSRPEIIAVLALAVAFLGTIAQSLSLRNRAGKSLLILTMFTAILALVILRQHPPEKPTPEPQNTNPVQSVSKPLVADSSKANQPRLRHRVSAPDSRKSTNIAVTNSTTSDIKQLIVGYWLPTSAPQRWPESDWPEPLLFKADGEFAIGTPLPPNAESTRGGTYEFVGKNRIRVRMAYVLIPDEFGEWDVNVSGNTLSLSVRSGFGMGKKSGIYKKAE